MASASRRAAWQLAPGQFGPESRTLSSAQIRLGQKVLEREGLEPSTPAL